ncbi:methyltransferase domain-containing protein [Salinicoccus sp. ID82-1]|uniref:putative RNA methyltransferase n=1 Tax=Salinicoccus sp. ID82-1 TaxID=2820269 RepID=UPI001F317243|nr:methyltransferase domain-containing protein [Salinicoccus sp. ID82-1]MCG1010788.1 methyltransferase domain-containing protein [Salinicoccus sp. ID82-1]
MKKKEKSAAQVSEHAALIRCPICGGEMHVETLASLVCSNSHAFDFAKQGYVNMLNKRVTTQYDQTLFKNRRDFILESGFYSRMHGVVVDIIHHLGTDDMTVLDAGSGEGSHMERILAGVEGKHLGFGIDIAKEGILMAAKNYPDSIWFVGDLANLPLKDSSCDVILNILSPANYSEFSRVIKPDGVVIKVVPQSGYLGELREALYRDTDKAEYDNAGTVSLFDENFEVLERVQVKEKVMLDRAALANLIHMSPLAWNHEAGELDDFISEERPVTIDLEILVGRSVISV